MSTYRYGGDVEQVYPQYLDTAKGSTLVASPGESYDIAQVAGLTVPDGDGGLVELVLAMPPDDRWSAPKRVEKSKENG